MDAIHHAAPDHHFMTIFIWLRRYPNQGRIVSMIGRYLQWTRDNRWNRVEEAYRLMRSRERQSGVASSAVEGLQWPMRRMRTMNLFEQPVLVKPSRYRDGDSIFCIYEFPVDRAREITPCLCFEKILQALNAVVPAFVKV